MICASFKSLTTPRKIEGKTQSMSSINKITISKLEIRNSGKYQMIKKQKIQNNLVCNFNFGICAFRFVPDSELRNSDFTFGASWRDTHC